MLKLIFSFKNVIYIYYNYLYLVLEQVFEFLMFYPVGIPSAILIILLLTYAFFIYLKELFYFVCIAEYIVEDLDEILLFISDILKFFSNSFLIILNCVYSLVYNFSLYIIVFKLKYFSFYGVVFYFIFTYM